jgi:hypothetical protein
MAITVPYWRLYTGDRMALSLEACVLLLNNPSPLSMRVIAYRMRKGAAVN